MKLFFSLLIFLPILLFSADSSEIEFLGFSSDGKYVGILEFGTYDGSGFPWASVSFIDVKKNDFVGKEIKVVLESTDEKSTEELAKKQALSSAEKEREKRKIPSFAMNGVASSSGNSISISGKVHNVSASTKAVKLLNPKCPDPYVPELLKLSVMEGGKTVLVLQDDKKIPTSRGCAYGYRLDKSFSSGKGIVVLVQFSRPGFEGPDARYLVITGMIP